MYQCYMAPMDDAVNIVSVLYIRMFTCVIVCTYTVYNMHCILHVLPVFIMVLIGCMRFELSFT